MYIKAEIIVEKSCLFWAQFFFFCRRNFRIRILWFAKYGNNWTEMSVNGQRMLFLNCFIGWLINWFICSVKFMLISFLWIISQMMHSFDIINSAQAFTVRILNTYTIWSNDIEQCQNILLVIFVCTFCWSSVVWIHPRF